MKLRKRIRSSALSGIYAAALAVGAEVPAADLPQAQFQTSDRCVACHNGMTTARGEDYSIGVDWSTSLMANASRDPYWQASLRRETLDHAGAAALIQNECSSCHMPIPQYLAKQQGRLNGVFSRLPLQAGDKESADGVTCSICHQITPQALGSAASFNGNFIVEPASPDGAHPEYGPFEIAAGMQRVMQTSTAGFQPQHGDQIRTAELCASCHTLTTDARDANGAIVGSLPEQRPYQEWLHSDFRNERTCQSCHMPAVHEPVPITRILGEARSDAARHQFIAANFVMQRMLGLHHDELDVAADAQQLFNAADRTIRYLQSESASLSVTLPQIRAGRLETDVSVKNLGGAQAAHRLSSAARVAACGAARPCAANRVRVGSIARRRLHRGQRQRRGSRQV